MKQNHNGQLLDRDAERERWIEKYRVSGMGLRRFAQRHGLKPGQLHYWVYQCPKPPVGRDGPPAFQELRLPAPALASSLWSAEIGLPNGTTVRLARETDLAWTIAVMNFLRGPCSPH